MIGGNVDLDLLSQIAQRYARIMGGIGRGASFSRSTMVGDREETSLEELENHWGRRGPYIGPQEKEPLAGKRGPDISGASTGYFRTP